MRLRGAVRWAVAAAVVLAGLYAGSGAAARFLPESSWGPRRSQDLEAWSVHVRVNRWTHAAEADLHYGKAEDFTLRAHGTSDGHTTDLEPTRFTLRPDGTIMLTRFATTRGGTGSP